MTTPPPNLASDKLHNRSTAKLKSLNIPELTEVIENKINQDNQVRKGEHLENKLSLNSLKLAADEGFSSFTVEQLIDVLKKSENSLHRIQAISLLGNKANYELNPERTVVIIRAINESLKSDKDIFVRAVAAFTLGQEIGGKQIHLSLMLTEVSDELIKALRVTGPDSQFLRISAIEALDSLDFDRFYIDFGKKTVRELSRVVATDLDPNVRTTAAKTLGLMCEYSNVGGSINSHERWRQLKSSSVPALTEVLLKDPSEKVRIEAANALGKIADEHTVNPLIQAIDLYQNKPNTRKEVVFALLMLAYNNIALVYESNAASKLIDIAGNVALDKDIRSYAIGTLSRLRSSAAIPTLLNNLSDQNSSIKEDAARALGVIRDPQAIPALKRVIDSQESLPLRIASATSAFKMGEQYGTALLVSVLEDSQTSYYHKLPALSAFMDHGNPETTRALVKFLDSGISEINKFKEYRDHLMSALIGSAKNNPITKTEIIEKFKLEEGRLKIWETNNIFINEGKEKYQPWMYKNMLSVFNSVTSKEAGVVNYITSEVAEDYLPNFSARAWLNTKIIETYLPSMQRESWFSEIMFHEHGHSVHAAMSIEDQVTVEKLYKSACDAAFRDGSGMSDISKYFVSNYSITNSYEFFAELEAEYKMDSLGWVEKAKRLDSKQLKEQFAFVAKRLAESDESGQLYTYIFKLKPDGTVYRARARIDSEGLPSEIIQGSETIH